MFVYTRAASQDLSHHIAPILFTCSYAGHLNGEMQIVKTEQSYGREVSG